MDIASIEEQKRRAEQEKALKKAYITDLINRRVLPFFREYLNGMYSEEIKIEVDFEDGQDDVRISADKNSEYIHYHIRDIIALSSEELERQDFHAIGQQMTTFQNVTGEILDNNILLPREEIDTMHLIHEFAHKFHWDLMKSNTSYQRINEFKNNYYFPALGIIRRISEETGIKNPVELYKHVKGLITQNSNGENESQNGLVFLGEEHDGVPLIETVFDLYLGVDVDETFAKSVERIYIENANLDENVKKALLQYRQDWFVSHPLVVTKDEESTESKTYPDEVFFRLYNEVGPEAFVECLKQTDYIELAKMRKIDPQTQKYSQEYISFLEKPSERIPMMEKDANLVSKETTKKTSRSIPINESTFNRIYRKAWKNIHKVFQIMKSIKSRITGKNENQNSEEKGIDSN